MLHSHPGMISAQVTFFPCFVNWERRRKKDKTKSAGIPLSAC